jgi:DNA excision repair protein ERCC-4
MTMDNELEPANACNGGQTSEFADEEAAMRDVEDVDEEEQDIMEAFATQTQTVPQSQRVEEEDDEDEDDLQEVTTADAPPVFRPLAFSMEENLSTSVKKRLRKGFEAVLEEQPKWGLLGKVLKEIEDTIARVSESHAGECGIGMKLTPRCSRYEHRVDHDRIR